MRHTIVFLAASALAATAAAQITVDGTLDAAYGSPLSVQTVQTEFGNASDPAGLGGGGELNAAYARVEGGRLFLMITGNVEPNFNKLNIFIDSRAGGENVLSADPLYDFNDVSANFGGLTFDSGFEADFHLFGRWGGANGNTFELDIVDRNDGAACDGDCLGDFGSATAGAGTGVQSGTVFGDGDGTMSFLSSPVEFGFNNTNTAGVGGGNAAADPVAAAAVTTGLEVSIALADLGAGVGDEIRIHAAYGNGDNNFHSNQVLGGLPAPQGNLGGDGAGMFTGNLSGIDFNNFAGDQFFSITVVPEPGALVLALIGGAACAARRRR